MGYDPIRTGIAWLDDSPGALSRGGLTLLAGRPAPGKTGLALGLARRASLRAQVAWYFSLAEGAHALADPLSGERVQVMGPERLRVAADGGGVLEVFGEEDRDTASIRAEVESSAQRPVLVVVDYLQVVREPHGASSRVEAMVAIVADLVDLARQAELAVLLTTQLTRARRAEVPDMHPLIAHLPSAERVIAHCDIVWALSVAGRDDLGALQEDAWFHVVHAPGLDGARKHRLGSAAQNEPWFPDV
ncbi:MAG: AAA family ATPase [Myxococcales bacterium]|nr:AAA family ATPase [Myxococcales bacterium]